MGRHAVTRAQANPRKARTHLLAGITVSFGQNTLNPGTQVIADITDVGSVGITSDLSANGFQTDVDGAAVEVGPLNGP